MVDYCFSNITTRPYGLPARLEWSSNIILRHAQKPAQGRCFGNYQTTNPKPWNPKLQNPENSESESRKHCADAVFSAISLLIFDDRESSMLQSGQTTGFVRRIRWDHLEDRTDDPTELHPPSRLQRHGVFGQCEVSSHFITLHFINFITH